MCIGGCGACIWRQPGAGSPAAAHLSRQHPTWRDRAGWVAYSAVPSCPLLGVTAHISTDIASALLLWTATLALYLLSFVNAFARRPLIPHAGAVRATAAFVTLAVAFRWREPAGVFLPLHLAAFLDAALACHAELAQRRPAAATLTEFYLFVSLGGLVGGAFVALLAPLLFNAVLEYPLGLVLAALLLPYSNRRIKRGNLVLASFIGALVLGGGPLAKGLGLPNCP